MSVQQPNRLYDLARGLHSWGTRTDGYNFQTVDEAFVGRMRDGKQTVADYETVKALQTANHHVADYLVAPGTAFDDQGLRVNFGHELGVMRRELAKSLNIQEQRFPRLAAVWESIRAAVR